MNDATGMALAIGALVILVYFIWTLLKAGKAKRDARKRGSGSARDSDRTRPY